MIPFPTPSSNQKTDLKRAALHVALGLPILFSLFIYALTVHEYWKNPTYTDFLIFHHSAENLLEGRDIFEPIPQGWYSVPEIFTAEGKEQSNPNLNPPFQTVVFSPFGLWEFQAAYRAWAAISLLCGLLGAILIGWDAGGTGDKVMASLVMTNVLLFYFPTFIAVSIGQWSLLPFLFLVLAWVTWRKGQLSLAGGILGILAAIKLFFLAFLLFFVARREWRAAASFVAVWLLCAVISAAITGPDSLIRYVEVLGEIGWYSASWNASFLGFVSRVFGEPGNDPLIHLPQITSALSKLLSLLGVFMLFLMARRMGIRETERISGDLAFSGCIVTMLLVSPLGWMYYFPFLLIPLAVIWRGSRFLLQGGIFRWLAILAWSLSTVPRFLVQASQIKGDAGIILGWAGAYFYALVLFLAVVWTMQKKLSDGEVSI